MSAPRSTRSHGRRARVALGLLSLLRASIFSSTLRPTCRSVPEAGGVLQEDVPAIDATAPAHAAVELDVRGELAVDAGIEILRSGEAQRDVVVGADEHKAQRAGSDGQVEHGLVVPVDRRVDEAQTGGPPKIEFARASPASM